jgi:hypothetical protein
VDRLCRADTVGEAVPDAGEHELQERQRALAAAGLLEQQLHGRRVDLAARAPRRLLDRAAQLVLAHHRHDHVLGRDQAGELGMLIQRPQEVAAQGHDDRDATAPIARGAQQVADEGRALLLVVAQRIQFLELVD